MLLSHSACYPTFASSIEKGCHMPYHICTSDTFISQIKWSGYAVCVPSPAACVPVLFVLGTTKWIRDTCRSIHSQHAMSAYRAS